MRLGDQLYFAPGLLLGSVDFDGPNLPSQYRGRINGFYLAPARACIAEQHAFAAGVLLIAAIDAMAGWQRIDTPRRPGEVAASVKNFVITDLHEFVQSTATRFYDDFRNGLFHEARIKNGGQFTFDQATTVEQLGDSLSINPSRLHDSVLTSLENFKRFLDDDDSQRLAFAQRLKNDFASELAAIASVSGAT